MVYFYTILPVLCSTEKRQVTKVWVPNLSKGRDYTKAESFGELRYFTAGYQSLGNLERLTYTFCLEVHKTDREDYLLLGGVILFNTLAALAWLSRHGRIKLLTYDSKINEYRAILITRDNLLRMFDRLTINEGNEKDGTPAGSNTSNTDSEG